MLTIDHTGETYGDWTVLTETNKKNRKVKAKCKCGIEKYVYISHLRSGESTSCGCSRTINCKKDKRLYHIWCGIKARCKYANRNNAKHYALKHIKICHEWEEFKVFEEWSINNGYKDTLSIDRIDNSLGYSPDNCRWVDSYIQNNNKSNNVLITIEGETHTLGEWSRAYNINRSTLKHRIERGWQGKMLLIKAEIGRNKTFKREGL